MENASKALLMAAEILLGVILIAIFAFFYVNWQNFADDMHINMEQNRITKFNSKFEVYTDKNDLTVHDIVTIVSFADEYNKVQPDDYYKIKLESNIGVTINDIMNTAQFLEDYMYNTFEFQIKSYNKDTKRVDTIRIIKTK